MWNVPFRGVMQKAPAVESTLECPLVSTFLNSLIIGGCNPVLALFSAYGWILHESGRAMRSPETSLSGG